MINSIMKLTGVNRSKNNIEEQIEIDTSKINFTQYNADAELTLIMFKGGEFIWVKENLGNNSYYEHSKTEQ